MNEIGIDISTQSSKSLHDVPLDEIDTMIILCDSAANYCPTLPEGKVKLLWPFPDPYGAGNSEEEVLQAFREVREAIRIKIEEWMTEKGLDKNSEGC